MVVSCVDMPITIAEFSTGSYAFSNRPSTMRVAKAGLRRRASVPSGLEAPPSGGPHREESGANLMGRNWSWLAAGCRPSQALERTE